MKNEEIKPAIVWFFITLLTGVFILVILPLALATLPRRSARFSCVNQEKQIAISIRLFAGDSEDLLPWEISTNNGGAREYIGTRDVYRFFLTMSNEISNPKILVCPKDKERVNNYANFFNGEKPLNSNSNISYLLNVTSKLTDPNAILIGDRNLLINGRQYSNGRYFVHTQEVVSWGSDIHEHHGNISLMDGSVRQTTSAEVQTVLQGGGRRYIGLAIP